MSVTLWLRRRATAGAVGNVVVFTLVAATATSRAANGVLTPAGLVAVVTGAAVVATITGWVAGLYEGVHAGLQGEVDDARPAGADPLAGRHPWRQAAGWTALAAGWAAAGSIVLAASLRDRSAPFPVLLVALVTLAATAATVVDLAARAAGARVGAALRDHRPEGVALLRRSWRDLAAPVAAVQAVVNAAAAWVLFHTAAADGTLTEGDAFGDALLVAALLAALFGALGNRWGAVDVAAGRVVVDADLQRLRGRGGPVGPQALVYAAGLALVATSAVGLLVPSSPSLLQVAIARGAIAGALTLVAAHLGYLRGALNAAAPAPGVADRPLLPPAGAGPARPRAKRRPAAVAAGAVAAGAILLPIAEGTRPADAQTLDGRELLAELDALGVRVEYDIPLPAGTGSAPQVVGAVRRSNGGEVANGIAAAPTRFDAVVGGKVANPSEDVDGEENRPPQAECAYPGPLVDIAYTFPADLRDETAAAAPIGHAVARCGAGPALDLDAVAASTDDALALGPAVTVDGGKGEGTAGPVDGVLAATASAGAAGVSILDGLVQVDSVVARGRSSTDGTAGGAVTEASIDLHGVSVAGVRFDVRDGDLVVDGERLPLGGSAAEAFVRGLGAALEPAGCSIAALDPPAAYPQGFLFLRPEPELGVADDGSLAGSWAGGLLVQCDLPADLTAPTGFSPQRVQVVLGFVFTSVVARDTIGGFGLEDLAGGAPEDGPGLDAAPEPEVPAVAAPAPAPPTTAEPAPAPSPPAAAPTAAPAPPRSITEAVQVFAANFAERPGVWVAALVAWALLTHAGIERVRREITGALG